MVDTSQTDVSNGFDSTREVRVSVLDVVDVQYIHFKYTRYGHSTCVSFSTVAFLFYFFVKNAMVFGILLFAKQPSSLSFHRLTLQ